MANGLEAFQACLTRSLSNKIYLLEELIGSRHWLTTGTFKEKVLISFLNETLPRRLRAKSGFVIFPTALSPRQEKIDRLNRSDYTVSKQLDLIVYDPFNNMPVFEDDDIVILPPEAVSNVVEVKGNLTRQSLKEGIKQLEDFSKKWRDYSAFRQEHHVDTKLEVPELALFAWQRDSDSKSSNRISGVSIREALRDHLLRVCSPETADSTPKIDLVSVFNDCVTLLLYSSDQEPSRGYMTWRGRNVVFDNDGKPKYGGDRTIFSLVRNILWKNKLLTNRFLIDTDESNTLDILPHSETGYTKVFDD